MEVAPFPRTIAACPALLSWNPWMSPGESACGRREDELPCHLPDNARIPLAQCDLNPDDTILFDIPVDYLVDILLDECYALKLNWESSLPTWASLNGKYLDAWSSSELEFTVTPSSEGGIDVRNHLSVLHLVAQMALFASCDPSMSVFGKDECAFLCQKSMVPKGISDIANKAVSSPTTGQAPEVFKERGAWGDAGGSIVQGTGDLIGVITDADDHCMPHDDRTNDENNKILMQIMDCCGDYYSEPEDINQQQQQQQKQQQQHDVGSLSTGVHWLSETARTNSVLDEDYLRDCQWETMICAFNSTNIPASMNCNLIASGMAPADCQYEQRFLKDPYQTCKRANSAPVINFMEQKTELELYSSTVLRTLAPRVTTTPDQESISIALKNTSAAPETTWIVASAAPHHATGNRAFLSNFTLENSDIVLFGGDAGAMPMKVSGRGAVVTDTMALADVWYVPGLAANLVSVSQLAELDYSVAFGRGKCFVRSVADGTVVGVACAGEDGLFALDFLKVPLGL